MQLEKIKRALPSIGITAILLLNVLFTATAINLSQVAVENQQAIVENQELMVSHLDALTDAYVELAQDTYTVEGMSGQFGVEVHMKAVHRDADGRILSISEHAGVLTTIGKDYIEAQLGGGANATGEALYVSLSNDATSPAVGWTELISEINANGLERALGAYTSTGAGVWTVDKTFTASGTQSAQLAGLQWDGGAPLDNNLLCADQMTSVSMETNDTLDITWTITIS